MFFLRRHSIQGFTVIEISIVLLLLTTLTLIVYKPLMSRMRVSDINQTVSEAQQIANFAESVRTKWLSGTTTDPVTGAFIHTYNTLNTPQLINSLPFDGATLFPADNPTGLPYYFTIDDDSAIVTTTMEGYQLQEFSADLSLVDISAVPFGVSFSVVGRPSFNLITTQTRKTKFDKSFWYQESIR